MVKPTPTRPTEKIQSRIPEMTPAKTVHWLGKTARTLRNHWDNQSNKRKCTVAYWDGLTKRYEALSEQAKTHKVWDGYCKDAGLPVDHAPIAVLK